MTDEQIKIIIAEACGWRKNLSESDPRGSWFTPQGDSFAYGNQLPDYLNDLNACAEFEKTLTDDELWEYSKLLMDYRQTANGFPLACRSEVLKLQKATARQRCIAFLKTKGIIP